MDIYFFHREWWCLAVILPYSAELAAWITEPDAHSSAVTHRMRYLLRISVAVGLLLPALHLQQTANLHNRSGGQMTYPVWLYIWTPHVVDVIIVIAAKLNSRSAYQCGYEPDKRSSG